MSNIDCYPFDPLIGPPPVGPAGGGVSTSLAVYTLCDPITGEPIEVRYLDDGAGGVFGPFYFDGNSVAIVPNLPLVDCVFPPDMVEVCGIPGFPCIVQFDEDANLIGNQNGSIEFTNQPFSLQQHVITYNLTLLQANFVENWYLGLLVSGFDPLRSLLYIPLDVPAWGTPGQIYLPVCAWWFVNPPVRVGNSITFDLDTTIPQIDGCPIIPEFGDYFNMLQVGNTSIFSSLPGPWGPVPTTNGGEGPFAYRYLPGGPPGLERGLRVIPCRTMDVEYMCSSQYGYVAVTNVVNDLGVIQLIIVTDPTTGVQLFPGNYGVLEQCLGPTVPCLGDCNFTPAFIVGPDDILPTTWTIGNYTFPGDAYFDLTFDLTNEPNIHNELVSWITAPGGILPGDMWVWNTTWVDNAGTLVPSLTGGATWLIGEWMLVAPPVVLSPTQIRFTLNMNLSMPCENSEINFAGPSPIAIVSIVNDWLSAIAAEYPNVGFLPGPINMNADGVSYIFRSKNITQVPVVQLCENSVVRTDQISVNLVPGVLDATGFAPFDLNSLDATAYTITVITAPVLLGSVSLPPGQYSFGVDAARGIVSSAWSGSPNFLLDASAGSAIVHWTTQL